MWAAMLRRSGGQACNGAGPAVASIVFPLITTTTTHRSTVEQQQHVTAPHRRCMAGSAATDQCLYTVLGVSKTSTASQIKSAYMDLAKKHHPDRSITEDEGLKKAAHDRFATISAAFDTLGDRFSRQEYDMQTSIRLQQHRDPINDFQNRRPNGQNAAGGAQEGFRAGAHHYYPKDEFAETRTNFKSGEDDNFRFMSNSTVVVLACIWMVGGALVHYWRFGAASEEVRAVIDERSRTAAGILNSAHSNAREHGNSGQLDKLREAKVAREARRSAMNLATVTTTQHAAAEAAVAAAAAAAAAAAEATEA